MSSIDITVTMFLMAIISVISLYADSDQKVKAKLLMNPYRTHRLKEYYRFISSGFVHSGLGHLFSNMFVLYFFGTAVESAIGPTRMMILFFLGVFVSDIPTYLKYKELPHYNSLGASGGVSSVLFCYIVYDPLNIFTLYIPIPIDFVAFLFGAIYLAFSYYQGKKSNDNINHDAHLYGALFGIAYAFLVVPTEASLFYQRVSGWVIGWIS